MMKTKKSTRILFALLLAAALIFTGCNGAPSDAGAQREEGHLTLRVNPEIEIVYNRDGRVTALNGKNDDGKKILSEYPDYIGKECGEVLEDLIAEIHAAGYFVGDVDGNAKNIVIQIEPGSILPADDFVEKMIQGAKAAVKGLALSSGVVEIDKDDYDGKYAKDGQASPYITEEKAQEIALTQAGVKAADVRFYEREFDFEEGAAIYELEFTAGDYKYEYDIDAQTGKVLKAEHEKCGASGSGSQQISSSPYITAEKAREAALAHAGVKATDARVESCELDVDDGIVKYEIEFKAGGYEYEYDVEAKTGEILKAERDRDDDTGSQQARPSSADSITIEKARELALAHAGVKATDARVESCELDADDGIVKYEIEFKAGGYEYEYDVEAKTGKILKAERNRDDD